MFGIIFLLLSAVSIVGWWKVFEKAGRPGWAALIPVYNFLLLLDIAGIRRPWLLLPFVVFIFYTILLYILVSGTAKFSNTSGIIMGQLFFFFLYMVTSVRLSLNFGKRWPFGLGLFFSPFVFFLILGFGKSVYQPRKN